MIPKNLLEVQTTIHHFLIMDFHSKQLMAKTLDNRKAEQSSLMETTSLCAYLLLGGYFLKRALWNKANWMAKINSEIVFNKMVLSYLGYRQ